jgi:hypothetical protein
MLSFTSFLNERVISPGFNPAHEKFREQHRQEIHDLIHKAYASEDGYGGHESGSPEESKAIHQDISDSNIKAVKRDGKITAVNLYKDKHGRKSIASATNGTEQGKNDWKKIKSEDNTQKRAWGEVSHKVLHMQNKMGVPKIPSSRAKELLGKDVTPTPGDEHEYSRKIGNKIHQKTMMGHPKIS